MPFIIGLALIIMVLVVSELALRRFRRTMAQRQYLREHGTTVTGTIIDTQRVKNKKRSPTMHYTRIEYFVKGKRYTMGNTWALTEQVRRAKNTPIDIVFEPSNPSNACVADSEVADAGRYGRSVRTFELAAVVILALLTLAASR
jgi:hypothetical protein